jgi:DNA invertase Pin-like site-specific DNA recombinase
MPKPVKRCAVYRRINDDDQKEGTSLSDQLEMAKVVIAKDGGVLKDDHIFTDTLSGNGKYWRDRDGIQRLLTCARRHEFDVLYIQCLDRFGRDVVIQEYLIQELKYYGVTVISLKEDEPTDKDDLPSQMARWFWGRMAQEELKKIRDRTQRGIMAVFSRKRLSWLVHGLCMATIGRISI